MAGRHNTLASRRTTTVVSTTTTTATVADGSITQAKLAPDVELAGYRKTWAPGTNYDAAELVFESGQLWLANVAHVSAGTFAADSARWTAVGNGGAPTSDGTTTVVEVAGNYGGGAPSSATATPDEGDLHIQVQDDVIAYFKATAAGWPATADVQVPTVPAPVDVSTKAEEFEVAAVPQGQQNLDALSYLDNVSAPVETGETFNGKPVLLVVFRGESIQPSQDYTVPNPTSIGAVLRSSLTIARDGDPTFAINVPFWDGTHSARWSIAPPGRLKMFSDWVADESTTLQLWGSLEYVAP